MSESDLHYVVSRVEHDFDLRNVIRYKVTKLFKVFGLKQTKVYLTCNHGNAIVPPDTVVMAIESQML